MVDWFVVLRPSQSITGHVDLLNVVSKPIHNVPGQASYMY